MTLNRRDFLYSSCLSASALLSLGSVVSCSGRPEVSDHHIARILSDYLAVGTEHAEVVQQFINDLRQAINTTEGPAETARLLNGERASGETERYVIQEFIRFSNYRMWLRRPDQTLRPVGTDDLWDEQV